jgi:hypothetical protein
MLTYAAIAGSALGVRVLRPRFKEIHTKRKEQETKIQKEIHMLEKIDALLKRFKSCESS